VLVVWTSVEGGTRQVNAALRPPRGAFGAPVVLSGAEAADPSVAMNDGGDAAVAWRESPGGGTTWRVRAANRPAGAAFDGAVTITAGLSSPIPVPDVAIDHDGTSTIVWAQPGEVVAATREPGGSYTAPTTVFSGGIGPLPQVAMDDAGETIAAWLLVDPPGDTQIQAARRPTPGDPFLAAQSLSTLGAGAGEPLIAMNADGRATVTYLMDGTGRLEEVIEAATRPAGAAFDAAVAVTPSEHVVVASVAVGGTGSTFVSWSRVGPPSIAAAVRPAAGPFGAPTPLMSTGSLASTSVAADGAGNALAAWTADAVNVGISGYDAVAPVINTTSVPTTATAGTAVTTSVDAVDVWGTAASWDFGDGSPTGSGAVATHTSTAAGDYGVTVTVTDPAGQTATAGPVSVHVADPPPPPPPPSPPAAVPSPSPPPAHPRLTVALAKAARGTVRAT
jgi:hypothetical protein